MLQSVVRRYSRLGVKVQHLLNKVFEFEVIRDAVPGLVDPAAARATGLDANDVSQTPAHGGAVLLAVFWFP